MGFAAGRKGRQSVERKEYNKWIVRMGATGGMEGG